MLADENQGREQTVFSCGYNGWADVPEEEREGLDVFEASCCRPTPTPPVTAPTHLLLPSRIPERKAA